MAPKKRQDSPSAGRVSVAPPESPQPKRRGRPPKNPSSPVASPKASPQASPKIKAQSPGKALLRKDSVYALTPDQKWLHRRLSFLLYGSAWVITVLLCIFMQPSFIALRWFYTLVGSGLLLYRVYYYAMKDWVLYFIDLCFVNTILVIWSLWACGDEDDHCSQGWLLAIYMTAQGPVGGATFPLQTPLALHHPEAFESFFMHASPMWLSYAVRWRWGASLVNPAPGFKDLVWAGMSRLYLPWISCYLIFLLLQPVLPNKIAGFETLMDGFIFPGASTAERLMGKREDYASFAKKVVAAVAFHALMSLNGFAAAALAYQHHLVQVVWLLAVIAGCVASAYHFYMVSAEEEPSGLPGLKTGFVRMGVAWAIVLPTYIYCEYSQASQ